MKDDLPIFKPSYQGNSGNDYFLDKATEVIGSLAQFIGAESLWRDIVGNKIDVNTAMNKVSAKILALTNLTQSDINKIQNYVDQLSNMGFVLTGAALNTLQKMKSSAEEKLAKAKNFATTVADRAESARAYLESRKPQSPDKAYNEEVDKFSQALNQTNNYMEDLSKAYEKSKISV